MGSEDSVDGVDSKTAGVMDRISNPDGYSETIPIPEVRKRKSRQVSQLFSAPPSWTVSRSKFTA